MSYNVTVSCDSTSAILIHIANNLSVSPYFFLICITFIKICIYLEIYLFSLYYLAYMKLISPLSNNISSCAFCIFLWKCRD